MTYVTLNRSGTSAIPILSLSYEKAYVYLIANLIYLRDHGSESECKTKAAGPSASNTTGIFQLARVGENHRISANKQEQNKKKKKKTTTKKGLSG